ncbi:MAG: formylglycine-generating enzyme family protein [Gammaproteobacteria bacterium]|nr:formylglycine-generating enzyme family protein [Gammaproteobacteria bacterium]
MYNKTIISIFIASIFSLFSFNVLSVERIKIPKGEFLMGCSLQDPACDKDEGPTGGTPVSVPLFYIDKYEVSVAEYKKCLKSKNCKRPKDFKRNKYCNLDAPQRGNHPINCIDWQDAKQYCSWKGGRLPFEAEWEKAARAGTQSRYPSGHNISCKNAIFDDGKTTGSVKGEHDGCGEDRTWNRAKRKANAFGLYDMHGNAGEWMQNWYVKDAITNLYAKGKLALPADGARKLVRGGSWDENRENLRSSFRNVKLPDSGDAVYGSIGFRCVYDK